MTIVSFLLFPSGKFKSDFTTLCTSKLALLQESFITGTFSAFEKTVVIPDGINNVLKKWQENFYFSVNYGL
jgi:hypothetical protein